MAVEVERSRRLFTVAEYYRMGEVGILKPDDRVELIRGEIVGMSPIGDRHAAFVNNLNELLVLRLAGQARVSVQNPVVLGDHSVPQPDLAVLRRRPVPYKAAPPTEGDVVLLIEVAETSLRYDRTTKLRLYAEMGMAEYWVVDCEAETIQTHRDPTGDGYRAASMIDRDAEVSPVAFPDVRLALRDVFA